MWYTHIPEYIYTHTHHIQYAIGVKSYTLYVEYVVQSYTYIYIYIHSPHTIRNRCKIIYIVRGICGTIIYLYIYTYTHDIQYAIGVKSYTLYAKYVVQSYTYICIQ